MFMPNRCDHCRSQSALLQHHLTIGIRHTIQDNKDTADCKNADTGVGPVATLPATSSSGSMLLSLVLQCYKSEANLRAL